jgi:hypothetical protein
MIGSPSPSPAPTLASNNHVLEIGGRAPLTVEAFVDKHRAAFL